MTSFAQYSRPVSAYLPEPSPKMACIPIDFSIDFVVSVPQGVRATTVIVHPLWDGNAYDAALLKLPQDWNFSRPILAAPRTSLVPNAEMYIFDLKDEQVLLGKSKTINDAACPTLGHSNNASFCAYLTVKVDPSESANNKKNNE